MIPRLSHILYIPGRVLKRTCGGSVRTAGDPAVGHTVCSRCTLIYTWTYRTCANVEIKLPYGPDRRCPASLHIHGLARLPRLSYLLAGRTYFKSIYSLRRYACCYHCNITLKPWHGSLSRSLAADRAGRVLNYIYIDTVAA